MSRTDDANVRGAATAHEAMAAKETEHAQDAADLEGIPSSSVEPVFVRSVMARASREAPMADVQERSRLIADIARLIREPAVPEPTRLAGLTLIGWLARRRPDESPHALGVAEAIESERRLRAAK